MSEQDTTRYKNGNAERLVWWLVGLLQVLCLAILSAVWGQIQTLNVNFATIQERVKGAEVAISILRQAVPWADSIRTPNNHQAE